MFRASDAACGQIGAQLVVFEDELGRHPQLGVYQLAVLLGAFERFGLAEPGGAAALAALLEGGYRPARDERVGVLISGGNTTAVNFG